MDARQTVITIRSVPAVFLVCFMMLGRANTVLQVLLGDLVAVRTGAVARWGVVGLVGRMFTHDARTGQTLYAQQVGGVLATAGLGSAAVVMAVVVALSPAGSPSWLVAAAVVTGFAVFHGDLARQARKLSRFRGFFAPPTRERIRPHHVGRDALLVLGPLVTAPVVLLVERIIDDVWAGAAAQDAVRSRLAATPPPEPPPASRAGRRPLRPARQVFDRFAQERRELTHIVDVLVRAADRLDPRAPHPTATLLRACAAEVRTHLAGLASLTAAAPAAIDTLLADVSILLIGPGHGEFYAVLPATAPQDPGPERRSTWSRVRRITDTVETGHRLVFGLVGIGTVVVLTVLVLGGQLSGTAFLRQ